MNHIQREILRLLDRPETRRGPWVITDEMLLKLNAGAKS